MAARNYEPDRWWIPLKSAAEERLVRENLELFVALALERFGYGTPQALKLEKRGSSHDWSAKFRATIANVIVKGEVTYLPKSHSLILAVAGGEFI
jgi:hypothetical protein